MITFISGKPSDLIDKIVYLQAFDPANPLLTTLLERETDIFRQQMLGSMDSDKFKDVTEKFGQLKARLLTAHKAVKEARHTLYNLAMSSNTTTEQFRDSIREFKEADQEIMTTKSEIDSLILE